MLKQLKLVCHPLRRLCSTNRQSEFNLTNIKSQLAEFKGGEVSLSSAGQNGSIAVISVSHPERSNAFSGSMCVSLFDHLQQLAVDEKKKAVIVCGLNGMFCAGADLKMAKQISDSKSGERFSYFMQTAFTNLRNLPFPSYALAQGNVLGGGAELLVACDQVIAHPNTKVFFIQGKMAIVPGWGGATHLVGRVGYHTALNILLSGNAIETGYAKQVGLVDKLIDTDVSRLSDEELIARGVECVEDELGHLPANVIQAMKSVALNATRLSCIDSIAHERAVFRTLWGADANLQALNANLKHA